MARQALAVARDNPEVLQGRRLCARGSGRRERDGADRGRPRHRTQPQLRACLRRCAAIVLAYLNRPDEAIAAAERAIRLSPNDPIIFNSYLALCLAHLVAGRYEEALSWADRAWGSNAGLPALRLKLSLLGHLGRREEASECLAAPARDLSRTDRHRRDARCAKGMSPELAARIAEGLRKAGLPEG